jgi:sugar/nucleoside kinase (ribokinase family)
MHLACLGTVCLDTILAVDQLPGAGENVRARLVAITPGGDAANTASWLAHLGVDTTLVGVVGDDPAGQALREMLADTARLDVQLQLGAGTIESSLMVTPDGQRTIVHLDPFDHRLHVDAAAIEVVERADLSWIRSSTRDLHPSLWLHAKRVATDWRVLPAACANLAQHPDLRADYVFGSLDRSSLPDDVMLQALGVHACFMTDGAKATHVWTAGKWSTCAVAPFVGQIVDTIGAGDAFVAGALHALVGGAQPLEAARAGHVCAAQCIGQISGYCA